MTPVPSEYGPPAVGDVASVSALGRIVRKRRRQLIALALLGALVGGGAAMLDPGFAAASRVLLQGPRGKLDVLTETELVTSQVVLDRAAQTLNWGESGLQLRSSVSAEALSGNVLEIRCTARNETKAQQLTDQVAEQYLRFSTGLVDETLRQAEEGRSQQVNDLRRRIADAEARLAQLGGPGSNEAERDLLRTTVRSANDEIADIDRQSHASVLEVTLQRSSIKLIEPAVVMTGAVPATAIGYVLGGVALFAFGGLLIHLIIASRDHRLVRPEHIAAALGAPALNEIPWLTSRNDGTGSRLGRVRRTAYPKVHWDTPRIQVDLSSLGLRYRRLFVKLGEAGDSEGIPMIVTFDDDAGGIDAVTRIAVAAGDVGRTCLVSDDQVLRQRVEAAAQETVGDRLTVQAHDQPISADCQHVVRVARVNPATPTVPDCPMSTDLLVAVGSGTRTPDELIALSDACADAGQRVISVIVALPAAADTDFAHLDRQEKSETPVGQPRVEESV